jgi:hypothetical protein
MHQLLSLFLLLFVAFFSCLSELDISNPHDSLVCNHFRYDLFKHGLLVSLVHVDEVVLKRRVVNDFDAIVHELELVLLQLISQQNLYNVVESNHSAHSLTHLYVLLNVVSAVKLS